MSLLGLVMSFFPFLHVLLIAAAILQLTSDPSWMHLLLLISAVYVLPVALFRLHELCLPIKEGVFDLRVRRYNPWWGSHCLQMVLYAFPVFERVLLVIPGAYSAWLRLWGSKVGRRVHYTPHFLAADRSLVDIGDDVIFGHDIILSSHTITPKKDQLLLMVHRIKIGNQAFVGAESRFSPGVTVADSSFVHYGSVLLPNSRVEGSSKPHA